MLGGKLEQKWRMKNLVIFSFQTGKSGYSVNVSGRILDFLFELNIKKGRISGAILLIFRSSAANRLEV